MEPEKPVLVLGIGNLLFKDEGVGIHVINELKEINLPPHVEIIDGGTASPVFFYLIENRKKLIVIDVLPSGGVPGTVYRLTENEFYQKRRGYPRRTTQETEFEDALSTTKIMKTNPDEVIVIGIEPEDTGEDDLKAKIELSQTLQKKLPEIIEMVIEEIHKDTGIK